LSQKILILGASSFVGRHMMRRPDADRFVGTYNRAAFAGGVHFDATAMRLADILPAGGVSHAVILMGDTQPDSCVADRARSQLVNVDSIKRVVDELVELGIGIVFTSSEFVYSGNRGNYVETDPADPVLLYGEQKLAVEQYLTEVAPDAAILRLAKVFGITPGDGTLFTGMVAPLLAGGTMRIAADQRFSPVYVGDVCDAIMASIERGLAGVYHVAGPLGASRSDFLRMMMTEVSRHRALDVNLAECSIRDFDLPEPRPLDVSMRPDKLVRDAGLELLRPGDACRTICERSF
jgi:dTDP-4-dehydrorhamnose reductase